MPLTFDTVQNHKNIMNYVYYDHFTNQTKFQIEKNFLQHTFCALRQTFFMQKENNLYETNKNDSI